MLRRLGELGVSVALDDFGTGHSSLTRLRNLPVGILKIDRTFVSGLGDDGDDQALVEASLALGDSLGLRVVAEGVETEQQLEALIKMGCRYGQGFLLHRPYPAHELRELLGRGSRERAA